MTYVNKESILAVAILFIILSIASVAVRLHIRRKKSGLGIDDWLCLPALVSLNRSSRNNVQNLIVS